MTTIGRSYRHPGPDLARVDVDASASGSCQDCPRTFRSFEACTRHVATERHTVTVTERREFHVIPRTRQEN